MLPRYARLHTPPPLIRVSSLAFPKQAVQAAQAAVQRRNARQQKKMQARQKLARERAQKLSIKNGKTAREEAARKAQVRARAWVGTCILLGQGWNKYIT